MPNKRTPPTLATALLGWFGPDGPAVAGDLVERYQSGESRWWYWRQTIAAISTTNDRWLIVRGVIVGWVTWRVFWSIVGPFNRDIMGTRILDALIVNLGSHPFVMFYAVVLWYRPMGLLGFLVSGWVVARFHRSCRSMAVFAFLTMVLVRQAWVETGMWRNSLRAYGRYPAYPVWEIGLAALMPFAIIAGLALNARGRGASAGASVRITEPEIYGAFASFAFDEARNCARSFRTRSFAFRSARR
jgi:hypothetical protein